MTELPAAGIWRCAAARLIDTLVGLVIGSLGAMWLVLGLWGLRGLPRTGRELLVLLLALAGLAGALHLVYHVVLVGGAGQTLGRMAVGIAVVDRRGGVPGYGRALVRSLGGALNALALGLLSVPFLFTRSRRGFADRLAGTRVVRGGRLTSAGGDYFVESVRARDGSEGSSGSSATSLSSSAG